MTMKLLEKFGDWFGSISYPVLILFFVGSGILYSMFTTDKTQMAKDIGENHYPIEVSLAIILSVVLGALFICTSIIIYKIDKLRENNHQQADAMLAEREKNK